MIGDGKDLLYVGTDPNGLVYRVNRKTKDVYVVHDAPETEISALALDKAGNLYAATAEAMPQTPESEAAGATEQIGRPEGGTSGAPIPSPSRPEPKPPELPNPNPGEPEPIPKQSDAVKKLMIMVETTRPHHHSTSKKSSHKPTEEANPATEPASA